MTLNVWSVVAGEQTLKVPDAISGSNIFGIAFSPDGKQIMVNASAATNCQGGHLRVWDSATGKVVWSRDETGHLDAEYSADGSRVCVISERDGMLDLDSGTGEVDRVVNATAKHGTGALMAKSWAFVNEVNGRVGFLSREDGSIRHMDRLTGVRRQVVALARLRLAVVLTQQWDNTLMIKSLVENGEVRDPLFYVGKLHYNYRLVGHPLSGLVALKNGDELKVWRLRDSEAISRIPPNWDRQNRVETYIRFQKFSGGQLFRARTHPEGFLMELFDANDPLGEKAPVASLAAPQASAHGSLSGVPGLAVWKATGSKTAMSVFEISRSGIKLLRDIVSPFELLDCLVSPDGRQVFGGHGILEARTGKEVVRMDRTNVGGHYESFWAPRHRIVELVHLGLDGEGGGEESSAKGLILWDGADGKRLKEVFARHASCLAISPDGRRFLEGGSDGKVRIRTVDTLEIEQEFRVENGPVVRVAWHPTLPLFVTKSAARGRVWDMSGVMQWESGRDLAGGGVMFSGDGKMLIFYRATEATTYAPEPFSQTKGK